MKFHWREFLQAPREGRERAWRGGVESLVTQMGSTLRSFRRRAEGRDSSEQGEGTLRGSREQELQDCRWEPSDREQGPTARAGLRTLQDCRQLIREEGEGCNTAGGS